MRKGTKSIDDNASTDDMLGHGLPKKRRICLFGDVNEACEKKIIEALEAFNKENSRKKILLYIKSLGGVHESGVHIAEAIRASNVPVYGIVIASARSAAFDVLQACKKRIACSNKAVIMCHAPDLSDVRVDQTDRDEVIKKRKEEHDNFLRRVVARTGGKLSFENMRDLSIKEEDISACRARRLGLLDRVLYKKKKKSKKRLDI